MTHLAAAPELIAVIVRLRQALVDNPLPTEAPGAAAVRLERDQLMNQLDDYILPRLVQLEAPCSPSWVAQPVQASRPWSTHSSASM
ncbi:MAG: hypothetical protein WKF73_07155 [Nocardioidaceae bacterium]